MAADFCCSTAVGRREVGAQVGLVQRGAANQGGGGHCDPNRPADVAQHVEQAGGVAHLLAGMRGGAHGGQRNKDKAERKAGEGDGDQQRVRADVEIDGAEDEGADGEAEKARR